MKVGLVGAGNVGVACLFAMATRGSAREVVLVNRNRAKARGAVTDLQYGIALGPRIALRDGDYADLKGAAVVAIAAGTNEKKGGATHRGDPEGRLRLLDSNAGVYRDIVPRIVQAAPDAILLVVTDPPDPLADIARALCKGNIVLGAGTLLDSLRMCFHLGAKLGVDPRSVDAMVLGEHGTSQVYAWSCARVAGTPVIPDLVPRGHDAASFRKEIEKAVRFANINIIEGTGASQLGIGVVTARIVEAILRDERAVTPHRVAPPQVRRDAFAPRARRPRRREPGARAAAHRRGVGRHRGKRAGDPPLARARPPKFLKNPETGDAVRIRMLKSGTQSEFTACRWQRVV